MKAVLAVVERVLRADTVLLVVVTGLSGEALGPRRFGLSAGIDPTYRGPASLEVVSESSVSAAQVALQGLTCD